MVVVVSAMGHNTDLLIDLAQRDHRRAAGPRDGHAALDRRAGERGPDGDGHRLAGLPRRSASPVPRSASSTDSTHTKARIQSISTDRMRQALDEGKIVIAAGFQGIDEDYNITTLGRGGSDTTAVALAAVLAADACEIYTDVDGVYTTDPRICPRPGGCEQISYDEMLELASLGAGVMHNRSIEFAKKFARADPRPQQLQRRSPAR